MPRAPASETLPPRSRFGRVLARFGPPTLLGFSLLYAVSAGIGLWPRSPRSSATSPSAPPAVREHCLDCHSEMTGFSPAHTPEAIGCAACHGGDRTATDATRAHQGMILIPGNLADAARSCGTAGCHETIVPRVERSLMTTLAGMIATDRHTFGEAADPAAPPPHVHDLGRSPADTHLRQLCVSCHLGQPKTTLGPPTGDSRGGGCLACHLVYSPDAASALTRYQATAATPDRPPPKIHPRLTIDIDDSHCFGCHSRSSRISTSYEGWHELRDPPTPATSALSPPASDLSPLAPRLSPDRLRTLEDGRVFTRVTADVHHERGLDCIDCHSAREVMGDGSVAAHQSAQVHLRCKDCHAASLASIPATALDAESALLAALRRQPPATGQRFGVTRQGDPLGNVLVDDAGRGQLRRKRTGELLPLKAPAAACSAGAAHARLACSACHTAWAPRCASCHTTYDPTAENFDHLTQTSGRGAWIESSGPFTASPPTLGVRSDAATSIIEPAVPGMILDLDRNRDPAQPPDRVFRRLYARLAPHTIRREARSCTSCHQDPVALGYGEGRLRYETSDAGDTQTGRWRFTPAHPLSPADGLPDDAWTGFLASRPAGEMTSARADFRPLNLEEQQRLLRAGACLTCHPGDSPPMRAALTDFSATLARRDPRCVLPSWSDAPTPAPR